MKAQLCCGCGELTIHGAPQNNHAQARERIDTDYQRLKTHLVGGDS
nr:YdfA protein [Escherichia coli]